MTLSWVEELLVPAENQSGVHFYQLLEMAQYSAGIVVVTALGFSRMVKNATVKCFFILFIYLLLFYNLLKILKESN
jgi:hypothetical protein